MIIYFACVSLSCFFTYLDTYKKNHTEKIGFAGWIAILISCFLAGAREIGVGSDTIGYGSIMFEVATRTNSLSAYVNSNISYVAQAELVYRIFIYLISRISSDIFFQFFIIQFVIMVFLYKGFKENHLGRYTWLAMFLYYMLFLGFSLNLMRQSMSIAIIFWGMRYIKQREFLKYSLVVIIASSFQMTSIVSIFLYPFYCICLDETKNSVSRLTRFCHRYRRTINICILLISVSVVIGARYIIGFVANLGIKKSYSVQYNNIRGGKLFNNSSLILMIMFIFPFWIWYRNMRRKNGEFNFYFMTSVISIIIWQISAISQEMYRIILFAWMLILIMIPKYLPLINFKKNRTIIVLYYMVLGTFYFVYYAVVIGANKIYPYVLRI